MANLSALWSRALNKPQRSGAAVRKPGRNARYAAQRTDSHSGPHPGQEWWFRGALRHDMKAAKCSAPSAALARKNKAAAMTGTCLRNSWWKMIALWRILFCLRKYPSCPTLSFLSVPSWRGSRAFIYVEHAQVKWAKDCRPAGFIALGKCQRRIAISEIYIATSHTNSVRKALEETIDFFRLMSADAACASRHGHTAETKTSVAISPKSVAQEWLPRFGAARACADGAGLQSNQEIGIEWYR